MLGPIGTPELVIILVVVLLIFGVGRISGVGRELGSSIKEFRKAVKDEEKPDETTGQVQQAQVQQPAPQQQTQASPPPPAQSSAPSNPPSETASGTQEPQKNIF
ncbi:MAG: twin-arginine translocase TatA/TatE family subunit [Dehalococcoidia bacterium]|nr:twin-arginine translocase TatA/TatE family subunit [Dehalococcoidia bacterium]MCA9824450.1 twin-arginine translocase TatA/TatE family subunit [Dehalococcoidia bacterium]MCA9843384.1 twin-arginine translocase TatA/TatE family subunit [Dehalococcoidia bacterium]MCA9852458.1 twin-arginine translocase TatA/TatE family subunit [Dehalococcoidia bacterium]